MQTVVTFLEKRLCFAKVKGLFDPILEDEQNMHRLFIYLLRCLVRFKVLAVDLTITSTTLYLRKLRLSTKRLQLKRCPSNCNQFRNRLQMNCKFFKNFLQGLQVEVIKAANEAKLSMNMLL
ncbi:hypothetical protein M8J76_001455 [Diaphorina citri]|nr:hypothetical protein M8J76_001455 [Diaphorina citri]KAI5753989.1 hypothetical protein M8J77_004822 [Diaphorina citri]